MQRPYQCNTASGDRADLPEQGASEKAHKHGPQWSFVQQNNGMWAIKLGGGSRNCLIHLYPAEFDALLQRAGYESWVRDAEERADNL